jgi:hypothetical protein
MTRCAPRISGGTRAMEKPMPEWKCLVCGNKWSGESNTCPLCSKYQPHEISCPKCGNITDAIRTLKMFSPNWAEKWPDNNRLEFREQYGNEANKAIRDYKDLITSGCVE